MALFNYATKEITIKIVYYGPGLSGKTTNLQYLHSAFDPAKRGKLLSLATEADRTLFFDFLPVELGKISDFSIRFQLYTVPGQVRYNATRKLVLKGADAIVFVADSQREMKEQNIESLKNMRENLSANNINPDDIPIVLQYNKRDIKNVLSTDELNRDLNTGNTYDFKDAIAIDGVGVEETFQHITKLVIQNIAKRHKITIPPREGVAAPPEKSVPLPPVSGEPSVGLPAIETTSYAASDAEDIVEPSYENPATENEPEPQMKEDFASLHDRLVKEQPGSPKKDYEPFMPREVVIKEIVEVPLIIIEKFDKIINGINDLSQTLKDLSSVVINIHNETRDMKKELSGTVASILSEMKELRKDQKAANNVLSDMQHNMENLREKKSWFRFS
jgi:signal recognition particle receptor subunit beta